MAHIPVMFPYAFLGIFQSFVNKYVIRALRYLHIFTEYEYLQSKKNDVSWTA
jgi:hypothetical protein